MKKIVVAMGIAFICSFVFMLGGTGILAKANDDAGKTIASELLNSKNPAEVWSALTDEEKQSVQEFAKQGESVFNQIQEKKTRIQSISALDEDVKLAALMYYIPVETSVTVSSKDTRANSTWHTWSKVVAKNILGGDLYWFQNDVWTTDDGSSFVQPKPSRSYTYGVYAIGWEFIGLDTNYSTESGGIGYDSYISKYKGHFTLGISEWDIQHSYPYIWLKVYPGGTFEDGSGY